MSLRRGFTWPPTLRRIAVSVGIVSKLDLWMREEAIYAEKRKTYRRN